MPTRTGLQRGPASSYECAVPTEGAWNPKALALAYAGQPRLPVLSQE